jgi:hypothetical protein
MAHAGLSHGLLQIEREKETSTLSPLNYQSIYRGSIELKTELNPRTLCSMNRSQVDSHLLMQVNTEAHEYVKDCSDWKNSKYCDN